MKKSLLLVAVLFSTVIVSAKTSVSLVSLQRADGIVYRFDSNNKDLPATLTVNGGYTLVIGANSGFSATDYYDLTAYDGIETKMTFAASEIGKTMALRFVMLDPATSTAAEVVKTITIASTSETVYFDFANDGAKSHKLWSVKIPWSVSDAVEVTFESMDVVSNSGANSIVDLTNSEDPNRLVDVYSITGSIVRQAVEFSRATEGLGNGLYVIDGKKVCVKNN
ncbi:MAG: hypothetical protein JXR39_13165 [Marinilabiliaceae bacterium]|nr:hypothetical protein [Marinilabiliaceae bacterium]